MSRSLATIQVLVARELEDISDTECRAGLATLLVEPSFQALSWEYGALGATRLCCIVAKAADGNMAVVYCEDGFAPTEPWGAVSLAEASMVATPSGTAPCMMRRSAPASAPALRGTRCHEGIIARVAVYPLMQLTYAGDA